MNGRKRQANTSLLETITADMLGGVGIDLGDGNGLRVERILLEMVRPDPYSRIGSCWNAFIKPSMPIG